MCKNELPQKIKDLEEIIDNCTQNNKELVEILIDRYKEKLKTYYIFED